MCDMDSAKCQGCGTPFVLQALALAAIPTERHLQALRLSLLDVGHLRARLFARPQE